ncbi:hypothetical protein [Thiohalocapsa sp. ML1]|uniref:hypothetical protein n=1 Tax=Thiohalocapsa sp. ML1 TaxID=1431688 RepID=UPI00073214C3|nr:hypothetical protein [Thiohalocapsa sp. ML1]
MHYLSHRLGGPAAAVDDDAAAPAPVPALRPVSTLPGASAPGTAWTEPLRGAALAPPVQRPKRRRSASWSPERSRTILRYRLAVGALAGLLLWSGSLIFVLWAQRGAVERELDTARADARTALHVLAELGVDRPVGAHVYRANAPILIEDGLVQDVLFVPAPDAPTLSARLTLFNSQAVERPVDLKVTLYDWLGLELGSGRPAPEYAHPLRPGELRTYQLDIRLSRSAEPAWFKVSVEGRG